MSLSKKNRFGLVWFIERFLSKLWSFFTNSWIQEKLVQISCLLSPCMTEIRSPGLTHLCDLEHLLAGRWPWCSKPMLSWHRHFSWLLFLPRGPRPSAIRFWKGSDICLIFLFLHNFISQLRKKIMNFKYLTFLFWQDKSGVSLTHPSSDATNNVPHLCSVMYAIHISQLFGFWKNNEPNILKKMWLVYFHTHPKNGIA